MSHCPNCGAEYMPGQTKCPECEIALIDGIPESKDDETGSYGKSVLLCKTGDVTGAEFLAETFRGENIPFVMNPGAVSFRMLPLEYGQKSIRFFVPASFLDQATEIAERILSDFGDSSDDIDALEEGEEKDEDI